MDLVHLLQFWWKKVSETFGILPAAKFGAALSKSVIMFRLLLKIPQPSAPVWCCHLCVGELNTRTSQHQQQRKLITTAERRLRL